jgi:hypothetical protein
MQQRVINNIKMPDVRCSEVGERLASFTVISLERKLNFEYLFNLKRHYSTDIGNRVSY